MTFAVSAVALLLIAGIAWGVWDAVALLRHLTHQQAATVQLMLKIEEKLASPEEYGAATWRELESLQRRNRLVDNAMSGGGSFGPV